MKGDTVHGFIDYSNRYNNPNQFFYTSSLDRKEESKLLYEKFPEGIRGFKAGNETFLRAEVLVEKSPKKTTEPKLLLETETVFLQILVDRPKSLYHYRDVQGKDHFYIQANNTYQLLKYKQYEKFTNGSPVIAKNTAFLEQLSSYLGDCEALQENISRVRYLKASLVKLFDRYYECTGISGSYQKPARIRSEWGVVAGLSITNLRFTSDTYDYLDKGKFSASHNPAAGIRLDFIFPKKHELLSLRNEFLSSSYSSTGSYTDYVNANNYYNYTTEFAYSYIKLNNLLQLNFPIKSIRIFLNAGISNGFALYQKNKTTEEHIFLEQVTVSEKKSNCRYTKV